MQWKAVRAFRPTSCDECGAIIGKDEECAWKKTSESDRFGRIICVVCYDRYGRNEDIQNNQSANPIDSARCNVTNPQIPTNTTPTTVKGLNPPLAPPSREEAIAKAHAENMAANTELVMAIRQLTVAVNDRTRLLVKNLEGKP